MEAQSWSKQRAEEVNFRFDSFTTLTVEFRVFKPARLWSICNDAEWSLF